MECFAVSLSRKFYPKQVLVEKTLTLRERKNYCACVAASPL